MEEIFEPFVQARSGGAERGPGLGLGLSIGRSIVEAHGGTLVAESSGLGNGATFRVVLRTADPTEVATIDPQSVRGEIVKEPVAKVPEEDRKSRRPTTILLVEDNRDSLSALAMSLSLLGYESAPRTAFGLHWSRPE